MQNAEAFFLNIFQLNMENNMTDLRNLSTDSLTLEEIKKIQEVLTLLKRRRWKRVGMKNWKKSESCVRHTNSQQLSCVVI